MSLLRPYDDMPELGAKLRNERMRIWCECRDDARESRRYMLGWMFWLFAAGVLVASLSRSSGVLLLMLALVAPAFILGLIQQRRLTRTAVRRRLGFECECGYELRGSADYSEPRCPECGREIRMARPKQLPFPPGE